MRFQSRVLPVPVIRDLRMFADSTSSYKVEDVLTPQLADLLPHAESLALHWLLEDIAVNEIDWNIDAYPGWDRDHELSAVAFFAADNSSVGPLMAGISTLSATTQYMRHMRLQIRWRLHTGVSVPKEAKLSCILYVTLKGI